MKSPKQQFQENKEDVKWLADLTADSRFQRACNYALLQYLHRASVFETDSEFEASALHFQVAGAKGLIEELSTLWKQPTPTPQRDTGNLTHK